MLIAYDSTDAVVGTLDYLVRYDEDASRTPLGLVDFEAHEAAGASLTSIWHVQDAVGSGTWPEWLGDRAHEFRVELEPGWSRTTAARPPHRIRALIHRDTGHRHERADIESAIAERIAAADGTAADIRDLVGGPDRPLHLDVAGRTLGRGLEPEHPLGAGGPETVRIRGRADHNGGNQPS